VIEIVIHTWLDDGDPTRKQLVNEHREPIIGAELAHPRIAEGASVRDAARQWHGHVAHQEQVVGKLKTCKVGPAPTGLEAERTFEVKAL
jgi:hypothetical protein